MKKLLLIFVLLCVAGCSLFTVSQKEISNSEKRWISSEVQNYNYTFIVASLNRDKECATPKIGIEIEVRGGKLTKFGTCELNVEKAARFGTVNRVFETLREEKSGSPPGLEVAFNEQYGYPEYIDINYSRWRSDYRVQYHILNFKVLE